MRSLQGKGVKKRIQRDWPFTFLAMWVSVMLATALLELWCVFEFP
jgi:hypothetical protein